MPDFSFTTWRWLFEADTAGTLPAPGGMDTYRYTLFLREKCGFTSEQAAAVVTLHELRLRARKKFPAADRMFFTPIGLEQSTDAFVAAYKASRFPAGVPVADICCGVGGDLCALAARGPVLGVEKDAITVFVAGMNLKRGNFEPFKMKDLPPDYKYHFSGCQVMEEDAENFTKKFSSRKIPYVHVDPDRRPAGLRSTRMEFFSPTQETLDKILARRTLSAVKLSPASEPPDAWRERGEMEWISRDGECRQLVAWFPDMKKPENSAFQTGFHRATVIAPHSPEVRRTLAGTPRIRIPAADTPGKYVFDVDSAVLAANLEGALAAEHGLKALAPGAVYLTGDAPVTHDAALSCFRILEVMPLDRKRLTAAVRARAWRTVEIKKRGDVPTPETVRKWLKLDPDSVSSGVIFMLPTPTGALAILAERGE